MHAISVEAIEVLYKNCGLEKCLTTAAGGFSTQNFSSQTPEPAEASKISSIDCGEIGKDSSAALNLQKYVATCAASYLGMVQRANARFNLMSAKAAEEIHLHLGDIWCAVAELQKFFTTYGVNCAVDAGSGAGFPAIPLAMVFPRIQFIGVESKQKKANFLKEVKTALNLKNFRVWRGNIQEFYLAEKADAVIARAFAGTAKIMKQCAKCLKREGIYLLLKGKKENILQELEEAKALLKGKEVEILPLKHPSRHFSRHLLVVRPRIE